MPTRESLGRSATGEVPGGDSRLLWVRGKNVLCISDLEVGFVLFLP